MSIEQQHSVVLQSHDMQGVSERKESSPLAFAVWIRQLLQNWRQGTVYAQGRSQVSRSGKKPWKQKGTGRARAGDARSPLWRGGGVIHGPQERSRTLKCCKKQKNNILNALLWNYVDNNAIHIVSSNLSESTPKTSHARLLLDFVKSKKITLFLSSTDYINYASFVNLPNVNIVYFDAVNAFDLSSGQCWIVLEKDINTFKHMVSQWN